MFNYNANNLLKVFLAGAAITASSNSGAQTSSTVELLKLLVEKGVISVEEAKQLIAEEKLKQSTESQTLRVQHVPESVRENIAQTVRENVKDDVTKAVISQAKQEGWGIAGALPDWVKTIKLSGDLRLRLHQDNFGADNSEYSVVDYQVVNEKGSLSKAAEKAYLNSTEDRLRLRNRARIQLDATINESLELTARLATGNAQDPVSTNQTLGNYVEKQTISLDQAYISGNFFDKHLQVKAGRMPSPFMASDLVWDSDLAFEGLNSAWKFGPSFASASGFSGAVMAGAFPVQEVELSDQDKWLYAAQANVSWHHAGGNELVAALGYFSYDNISGQENILDSKLTDFTAPKNMQRGNSVFDIRTPSNPSSADQLFALAADYNLLDFVLRYDITADQGRHLIFSADYVTNLGYEAELVAQRVGQSNYAEETDGYKISAFWGVPKVSKAGQWNVEFAYRHLERDAVVDAFTDSDFLLGGTDNKGYIISGEYAVLNNTAIKLSYLSASSINPVSNPVGKNADFDVDTIELDLNVKF